MIINHGFIKNKLKIIYNNTIFFNQRYGGISRYYDSIFKIFIQKKIEFKVISPIYKNIYLKNLSHKFKTGIYIPRYPMSKIIKKFNDTLSYKLINKCKYEILHDTYYTPSLSKIKNKKKFLTIHDLIHEKLNHYYHFKDLINYKKKIFENIDNFICVSNTTKEDFLNIYKIPEEKVKVIYHGSDHLDSIKINKNNKKFKFKDALNKPFILYVGNRNRYKNFEILINSFKNSAELNDNFNIVCFGGEKISKIVKYFT